MANRYWVGGTATWDATAGTKWATTSGGAGGAAVPTSVDDVFFDAASGAVTVTTSGTDNCNNLVCTGFTGTLTGDGNINCYGSAFTLVAGMSFSVTGVLTFATSCTLTSGGKTFAGRVQSTAGTLTLADAFVCSYSHATSAALQIGGSLSAGTYTVTFTGSKAILDVTGGASFYGLTYQPSPAGVGKTFTVQNGPATVTNALTLSANSTSALNRALITGAISCASGVTITSSYCDYIDFAASGTHAWNLSAATGLSGNCGGNTGVTLTSAITCYAKTAVSANFSGAIWFTTSGGSTAARVPLPQDAARFDANSVTAGSCVLTQDLQRIGSVDWTGVLNSPAFTTSTTCSVFGSMTLISGMTLTASAPTYTFEGRGSTTLTSAGKTWGKNFDVKAVTGTLTLQDALTCAYLSVTSGTLTDNGNTVSFSDTFSVSSGATLNKTGNWTISFSGGVASWACSTGSTINDTAGYIKFSGSYTTAASIFAGGDKTFNNLWFDCPSAAVNFTITGANTFNDIRLDDGAFAHTITFPNSTTTVTTFTVNGAAGKLVTLQRTGASGTWTLAKSGAGTVDCNYLAISNSTATPGSTFFANDSTNGGGNTDWTFVGAGGNNLFFGSNF